MEIKKNHFINSSKEKYCQLCGKSIEPNRINHKYIIKDLGEIFNLEKGIFFTLKKVLMNPGSVIKEYLYRNRQIITKPFAFFIFCLAVKLLFENWFNENNNLENIHPDLYYFLINNPLINYIFFLFFVSLWLKLFFRSSGLNIYEIIVLSCYTLGMIFLIDSFTYPIDYLVKVDNKILDDLPALAYYIYAIGSFFKTEKFLKYPKALIVFYLGAFSYGIIMVGVEFLIKALNT